MYMIQYTEAYDTGYGGIRMYHVLLFFILVDLVEIIKICVDI